MRLLRKARELERYELLAVDGAIGSVEDVCFEDSTWAVRYLVVNTGGWLKGRRVLISTIAIGDIYESEGAMTIELTRNQIEHSPPISTSAPVSRRYEMAFYRYYNWVPYWEPGALAGFPMAGSTPAPLPCQDESLKPGADDTHVRSTGEVSGYAIEAMDGRIGHVVDFILDTRYWRIRYLEIDTRNWLPGEHVLINPDWIEQISWAERVVVVSLSREAIVRAPAFDDSKEISRDDEVRLFSHYGRPVYWRPVKGKN